MAKPRKVKKLQLVADWKQGWKFLSVQLATVLVVLQVLEENLPAVQHMLPEGWVKYIGLAILIGRLIQQQNILPPESEDQDSA